MICICRFDSGTHDSNEYKNMEQDLSAINPYNGMFGQQGWICPKCGRVYSPFIQMCLYCKPNNTTTISNLGDLSNTTVSQEKLRENRKTE